MIDHDLAMFLECKPPEFAWGQGGKRSSKTVEGRDGDSSE